MDVSINITELPEPPLMRYERDVQIKSYVISRDRHAVVDTPEYSPTHTINKYIAEWLNETKNRNNQRCA